LAVLGVTEEHARTATEVIAVVKRLGGARFQPTAEVIAGRIAALFEEGLLRPAPEDQPGEIRWQPSAAGQAHVQRLLMMPSGSPVATLAAVCACLNICFLEILDPVARDAVMDDLMAMAVSRRPCRPSMAWSIAPTWCSARSTA
jgi:Putative AphA-like transcriptional regulator